jgi:cytochrome c biogenesis protein CcmG/thiol:disulfide interchange protein DsbE
VLATLVAACGGATGGGAAGGGANDGGTVDGGTVDGGTGGGGDVTVPAASLPDSPDALPEMDLAGFETLVGDLRGTPVLVNVWASWCGPCNEEAPRIAAAHASYGDRIRFVGVDILDSREGARDFIATHGWAFPSVFDPDAEIRDGLGLIGQPVTLFYAADGTLVSSYTGPIPEAELEARIAEILPAQA